MPKKDKEIITQKLYKIEPVMINAALVSAQNRKRLFWIGALQYDGTYKQVEMPQPEDRNILLKDILEIDVDDKFYVYNKYNDRIMTEKCGTLGTCMSRTAKQGYQVISSKEIRKLTPVECERLQSLPDNYTEGVSNTQRYKALGNGFNVEVIAHILKYIKL